MILRNLTIAVDTFRQIHHHRGISICEVHTADLNQCNVDTAGACGQYIQTFTRVYGIDHEPAFYALARLADSTNPVHAPPEVEKWTVVFFAFVMRPQARSMLKIHQALRCLGDVLAQQQKDNDALSILTVALEGFTWMDVHQSRGECMRTIGDVHFRHGEFSKAFTFWTEARPLFERSSQTKSIAEIDNRLAELHRHHEANLGQLAELTVPTAPLQQLSISEKTPAKRGGKI
jgi:hypothetical protein